MSRYAIIALVQLFAAVQAFGAPAVPRQARSVHLLYHPQAEAPVSAMVSVRVLEAQTNSYYMALGWKSGYCGVQDINGRKVFIFSVWEPGNPLDLKAKKEDVALDRRARVKFAAEGVETRRFEGEGTGMRTLTDLDWKTGDDITIRIDAAPDGDERVVFDCSVKVNRGQWRRIAAISTVCRDPALRCVGGVYSFIEDFWRNGASAALARRAEFRDVKTRGKGGDWVVASEARFTADDTPANNIDAGATGDGGAFLATGGATANANARLDTRFAF